MRFYNPTPRDYRSTFVDNSLPYDFLLKAGQQKQGAIDDQYGKIEALKKTLSTLPVDSQEAAAYQTEIDNTINSLRDYTGDPTDPSFVRKVIDSSRQINSLYNEADKVYGARKTRADEILKDIDKLPNKTLSKFLRDQLREMYYTTGGKNPAQYDKASGNYSPIQDPDLFNWEEEIDQKLSNLATNVESDKIFGTYGVSNLDEFNKKYLEGTVETRDYDKIMNSLYGYANTPEVAKTLAVQRAVNYGDNFDQAYSQEQQSFTKQKIKNKKGEEVEIVRPNLNTLLGQKIDAAINARVTTKEDLNSKIFDDFEARQRGKINIENELNGPSTNTVNISAEGNADFVQTMPTELSKFYDGNGNLSFDVSVPVDKITFTSQGVAYPTDNKSPEAVQYAQNMIEAAKNIRGINNKQIQELYNKIGFKGIENYVKSYYQNVSLIRNNVQMLQPQEEQTFTQAFLGTDKKGNEDGVNYRQIKGRVTDQKGNLVKNEDITNQNTTVIAIDYNKPGMLVLASNNGEYYKLESTNQDLIRATRDVSEIKNKALSELKNPKAKNRSVIDKRVIKYQDGTSTVAETVVVRDNGFPEIKIIATSVDEKGNVKVIPLESNSIDDFEKYNTSKLLNSKSFRALIKQKEVKQEFEE